MFSEASSFNQDLSNWCVKLFVEEPYDFAINSVLQDDNYPVWGTCPTSVRLIANDYADSFNVYPNPIKTILTIETKTTGLHDICITSLNGQLLLSGVMEGTIHKLDLSSFQKGVYLITIMSKDLVTMRR